MANRYIPLDLKHAPTPKIVHFAILAGMEAAVRGTLVSTMPLAVYHALGSAQSTSVVYFVAGLVALVWGLMVPWATRKIPRRWAYTGGTLLYILGNGFAILGQPWSMALALVLNAMATATLLVCFNAYVLDYVQRSNLGRSQSVNLTFAAAPWTLGPVLGVWLYTQWAPAPFLLAGGFALILLVTFWILRLGNGKQIAKASGPAPNPLGYLGRFAKQPRLLVGYSFAVVRSCGWWVYIVYLPIYCVENGLSDKIGGIVFSASNACLFFATLVNTKARALSIRRSIRFAFGLSGLCMIVAALLSFLPWVTVAILFGATLGFFILDVIGSLPFLMAVRPSERTEMSAVFSSFRDVSGIITPGVAWLLLLFAPLPAIFAVSGAACLGCLALASSLHPRLGVQRPSRGGE